MKNFVLVEILFLFCGSGIRSRNSRRHGLDLPAPRSASDLQLSRLADTGMSTDTRTHTQTPPNTHTHTTNMLTISFTKHYESKECIRCCNKATTYKFSSKSFSKLKFFSRLRIKIKSSDFHWTLQNMLKEKS